MPKVAIGSALPTFLLPSTSGADFSPADARGGPLVLYFYPKDATPGCTTEAEAFRDLHAKLRRAGAQVLGISRDSLASHAKFRERLGLPFHLLSDTDEKVCRLFDVIREKNMYGKTVLGIERSTFLADAKGMLRREWRKVKVNGHAEQVLEAIRSLD
jgi:thioredoxin-dependent peroxiredoxin